MRVSRHAVFAFANRYQLIAKSCFQESGLLPQGTSSAVILMIAPVGSVAVPIKVVSEVKVKT